jgi:hypothetical protein
VLAQALTQADSTRGAFSIAEVGAKYEIGARYHGAEVTDAHLSATSLTCHRPVLRLVLSGPKLDLRHS